MVLSKTFGYALRSILFIAGNEGRNVSIDTMAHSLQIPKHFLAKVMKDIVKAGVVDAIRGKNGGFYSNEKTSGYTVSDIVNLIEGENYFNGCLLNMGACNTQQPCPLHHKVVSFKNEMHRVYCSTRIIDLLTDNKKFESVSSGY